MKQELIQKIDLYLDKIITKRSIDLIILFFAVIISVYLNWSLKDIVFFMVIVWLILNPVSSQLAAKFGLLSLIFSSLFIWFGRNERSDSFAIMGYGLITLSFVMAVYELRCKSPAVASDGKPNIKS